MLFGASMIRDVTLGKAKLDMQAQGKGKIGGLILNGIIISVMNPYFVIWWAAVGLGLIMSAYNAYGIAGIILFYFGHILSDFTWYFGVSLLCDRVGRFIGGKAYRMVIGALGSMLGFFAVKFILDGISLLRTTL
jgi:threonine/homoserine/homoserine lactone efflux protein